MKNIGLIGTVTTTRNQAPYASPDWEFWVTGPDNHGNIPKTDVWFEMHDIDTLNQDQQFAQHIINLEHYPKVIVQDRYEDLYENTEAYPKDRMIEKYGRDFFTSSVAWMLALAIEKKPKTIGLWGIDMNSEGEYAQQRAGCKFFIREAKLLGIDIVVPIESDLLQPPPLYGYCGSSPLFRKMQARKKDVTGRMAAKEAEIRAAQEEVAFLKGAAQDMNYVLKTWV